LNTYSLKVLPSDNTITYKKKFLTGRKVPKRCPNFLLKVIFCSRCKTVVKKDQILALVPNMHKTTCKTTIEAAQNFVDQAAHAENLAADQAAAQKPLLT
jgi:hypothetical protein